MPNLRRHMSRFVLIAFVAANLLLFQNCGGGFKAAESFDLARIADSVVLTLPVITANVQAQTESKNATISFSSSDSGSGSIQFNCVIDGAAAPNCTSPIALSNLSDGDHVFSVQAIDKVGNQSASASFSWLVQATAPLASCQFNGATVPSGQTVKAYAFSFIGPGQSCIPEDRLCTDGVLSGSEYSEYSTCELFKPKNVTKISVGMKQACVIIEGKLGCWRGSSYFLGFGTNFYGGAGTPQRPVIVEKSGVTDVDVKGDSWGCHIMNGALMCNGAIKSTPRSSSEERYILAASGATSVFIPQHGTMCAELSGTYKCWENILSAIDNYPTIKQPRTVTTNLPLIDAAVGVGASCFIPRNGSLVCNDAFREKIYVASNVTKVSMSRDNTVCAVVKNELQCFLRYSESSYESGFYLRPDGTRGTSLNPEVIMNDVVDVDVVSSMSQSVDLNDNYFARAMCVVKTNGAVVCWGNTVRSVWMPPRTYIANGAVSVKVSHGADGFIVVQMADGTVKSKAPESDVFEDVDLFKIVYPQFSPL